MKFVKIDMPRFPVVRFEFIMSPYIAVFIGCIPVECESHFIEKSEVKEYLKKGWIIYKIDTNNPIKSLEEWEQEKKRICL